MSFPLDCSRAKAKRKERGREFSSLPPSKRLMVLLWKKGFDHLKQVVIENPIVWPSARYRSSKSVASKVKFPLLPTSVTAAENESPSFRSGVRKSRSGLRTFPPGAICTAVFEERPEDGRTTNPVGWVARRAPPLAMWRVPLKRAEASLERATCSWREASVSQPPKRRSDARNARSGVDGRRCTAGPDGLVFAYQLAR